MCLAVLCDNECRHDQPGRYPVTARRAAEGTHPKGQQQAGLRCHRDEIFTLSEQKSQAEADTRSSEETQKRIAEIQDFIAGQETDNTEFDEALLKKLIEKITIFADHFTVEFKSGIIIDIEA